MNDFRNTTHKNTCEQFFIRSF